MRNFPALLFILKCHILKLYDRANKKCFEQFSFGLRDISYKNVIEYLNTRKDSSSLAITRILFGICMLFDIPDERGGAIMTSRWGDPNICHFPLIPFITVMPMPYMAIVYLALWIGSLGITLGYKYSLNSWMFTFCYWYLFLIEKSFWNNHSYLFGLVALLLSCTDAAAFWSIDTYLDPAKKENYCAILELLYSKVSVFHPVLHGWCKKRLFLTVPQIDYLIVHWFIFLFDLTIAFWMMWSRTRNMAMIFCALFHLMNSRLFRIGMFPWVCLATMPLFYPFDWPKKICQEFSNWFFKQRCQLEKLGWLIKRNNKVTEDNSKGGVSMEKIGKNSLDAIKKSIESQNKDKPSDVKLKKTAALIFLYVIFQAFLPFSHFITKGYNNWTDGLYGYSWDMMVHTWDINSVVIKVTDSNQEYFVDPYSLTPNDRWTRHGDMIHQYAHCLRDHLRSRNLRTELSIFIEVWCSLNGRYTQRMFDSRIDILNATWSPFREVQYLMPLLEEGLNWRSDLQAIRADVHSWNNYSDVIFIADFPGYEYEKFITEELTNVSLTVLKGKVLYENMDSKQSGRSQILSEGEKIKLKSNEFHRVKIIESKPAFYMYSFANMTEFNHVNINTPTKPLLPIFQELTRRYNNFIMFSKKIIFNLLKINSQLFNT